MDSGMSESVDKEKGKESVPFERPSRRESENVRNLLNEPNLRLYADRFRHISLG